MWADAAIGIHFLFLLGLVVPIPLILIGRYRAWAWIRRRRWRQVHLGLIILVLVEAVCRVTCPLTWLEVWLREKPGAGLYQQGWLSAWVSRFLFHDWPAWAFTSIYAATACIIAVLYLAIPPD